LNDDKIVNLEKYKAERTEKRRKEEQSRSVPTLMAFLPNEYYIFPEMGLMIHVLFLTDKSIHYDNQAVYVMEDQYGNIFADVVDEETCDGWHPLHRDVFMEAVGKVVPTDPDAS
jgi:hypothetical protein